MTYKLTGQNLFQFLCQEMILESHSKTKAQFEFQPQNARNKLLGPTTPVKSGKNLLDNRAEYVSKSKIAALVSIGEPGVIDSH
jgi:hypothetical protein